MRKAVKKMVLLNLFNRQIQLKIRLTFYLISVNSSCNACCFLSVIYKKVKFVH